MMKTPFLVLACLVGLVVIAAAEDTIDSSVSVGLYPRLTIPLGQEDRAFFSTGYGGTSVFRYRLPPLPFLSVGARVSYDWVPVSIDTEMSAVTAAADVGLIRDVGSRLQFHGGVSGGYYNVLLNDGSGPWSSNPYLETHIGVSLRVSSGFSVGAEAAYRNLLGLYDGTSYSLAMTLHLRKRVAAPGPIITGPIDLVQAAGSERLALDDVRFTNIFPVFYSFYDDNPVGVGRIVNRSESEVENINVNFFIKQYMDNPKAAAAPERLEPGEDGELQIFSLFRDSILGITEGSKVSAEITVNYTTDEQEYRDIYIQTVRIRNRNATTWDDDRKVAAFVTAKDPSVLALAKHAAAIARERGRGAVSQNLRTAVALQETYRLYGLSYVIDPTTPYSSVSASEAKVDFLQFPRQTLQYRAGDCDDLSILTNSAFEAVGIETAFVTIPGHIFIAFDSGVSPAEAARLFSRTEDLIFRDDTVWIPFEVTALSESFLEAWRVGARQWREAEGQGSAGFYRTRRAWQQYEPAGLPGVDVELSLPERQAVSESYFDVFSSYVEQEVQPRVARIQVQIDERGETPRALNRLGTTYARYGLLNRAEELFRQALELDPAFISSLINLGNTCYLSGRLETALEYFNRAAQFRPKNTALLVGLAKTYHALEQFELCAVQYGKLQETDPELAERFAYLGSADEQETRAASPGDRAEETVWHEE